MHGAHETCALAPGSLDRGIGRAWTIGWPHGDRRDGYSLGASWGDVAWGDLPRVTRAGGAGLGTRRLVGGARSVDDVSEVGGAALARRRNVPAAPGRGRIMAPAACRAVDPGDGNVSPPLGGRVDGIERPDTGRPRITRCPVVSAGRGAHERSGSAERTDTAPSASTATT